MIRVAQAEDVGAIVRLVNSAYRGESSRAGWTTEADLLGGQRTDAAAIAESMASGSTILLLCQGQDGRDDGGEGIAACVSLEPRPDGPQGRGRVYLGMLTVDPRRQRDGLGRALLDGAERHARERMGAESIEMTVISARGELLAWYARRGYSPTGERRPFPYGDERFGLPLRGDLEFVVLGKRLVG